MFVNKRQKIPPPRKNEPQKRVTSQRNIPLGQEKATNQTKTQPKSAASNKEKKTLDWDDISLSSDDSRSFKRFLKKQDSDDEKETAVKMDKEKSSATFDRPKTSRGSFTDLKIPGEAGTSTALDRFAKIEARIKSRQQGQSINKVSLSVSDLDSDFDSKVRTKSKKGRNKSGDKVKSVPREAPTHSRDRLVLADDESSESLHENLDPYKKFIKQSPTFSDESDGSSDNRFVRERGLGKSSEVGWRFQILRLGDAGHDFYDDVRWQKC